MTYWDSGHPFRWRTWLRSYLPWFLIDLGVADKGEDCEQAGGRHWWYNKDGQVSACYHCRVERAGQLWQKEPDLQQRSSKMAYIRITGVPAGEAPLHIRQAWVGCILPLPQAGEQHPKLYHYQGVISGARKTLLSRMFAKVEQMEGYAVLVAEALNVLAQHNPVAAQWWYENTPHLLGAGNTFVFEASVCQKIPDSWEN